MVVLANGTILRNSGRRTVRLKSKGDDGMNPWIQPRPLTAHPSHRATHRLPESVSFLFWAMMQSSSTRLRSRKLRFGKTKGKHHDMCVRRSDTYSEEMG